MPRISIVSVAALLGILSTEGCDKPAPAPPVPPLTVQGPPLLSPKESPQRILSKALKAHGGVDHLARWNCGRVKYQMRSDTIPQLNDTPATIEEFFQLPGHLKRVTVVREGKQQKTTTCLVTGDEGWEYLDDGSCRLVPGATLNAVLSPEHAFFYFCNLARLRAPGVGLTVCGTELVNNRPAVVVHAEAEGANPMDYCFDTVTALLVRLVRHLPQPKGRECVVEVELGDYHEISGGPIPLRIRGHSDGQTLLDFTLLEVEFLDHCDDSIFTAP
jgi:hypothetical protein